MLILRVRAVLSIREGLVILDEASYCVPVWTVRPVRCFYGPVSDVDRCRLR